MEIVNQKVIHKVLGEGIITWFGGKEQNENKYIRVQFSEKSIEFQYPTAFKSFIKATDPEFEQMINHEIQKISEDELKKREAERAETKAKNTHIVKSAINQRIIHSMPIANNVLRVGNSLGTNSKSIYLKCCQIFGWDESRENNFGRQGALLYAKRATPEGYSPWFLSNHNLENTKGGKWNNTIEDDFIFEEWDEEDERMREDKTNRIVFLKLKGDDKINLKENGKYTKVYKRISKVYPI